MNLLPSLYHAHHLSFKEDLPFWLALAERLSGPVLELGCGTGRVLIPLANAGNQSFGLDRDIAMLSFLRRRIPRDLEAQIHLFQADLAAFRLAARFPLILLPCNTYSTLDAPTRAATLRCVRDQLSPGGLFVFSVPNPAALAGLEGWDEPEVETHITHPKSGHPIQVSSTWERGERGYNLRWHYDHLFPDGRVERWTVSDHHYHVPLEIYLAEVETRGLSVSAVYGGFDFSPYEMESPYLIIVVERE